MKEVFSATVKQDFKRLSPYAYYKFHDKSCLF